MIDAGLWVFTSVALATAMTLVITGALLYSVYEIARERMSFWERMHGK